MLQQCNYPQMESFYNTGRKSFHFRAETFGTKLGVPTAIIQSVQLLMNANPQRYWAYICCSDLMIFEGCDKWLDHQGAIRDIANRVIATDAGGISRIKLYSSCRCCLNKPINKLLLLSLSRLTHVFYRWWPLMICFCEFLSPNSTTSDIVVFQISCVFVNLNLLDI